MISASQLWLPPQFGQYPPSVRQGLLRAKWWVSPTGSDSNPGTFGRPKATIKAAHDLAKPGDVIIVRGGVYSLSTVAQLTVDGTAAAWISIIAYPGETPILDATSNTNNGFWTGAVMQLSSVQYLYMYGIDFYNGPMAGLVCTGTTGDIIIDSCRFYENGRLAGGAGQGFVAYCTGNNGKIIRCDSFLNVGGINPGDGDGFRINPGQVGTGWGLYYCRAWLNSDDGFDCLNETNGADGTGKNIVLEHCWAWENGFASNGTTEIAEGDGNGIKLGGQGNGATSSGGTIARFCLSWRNKYNGFTTNGATTPCFTYNCTGWNNDRGAASAGANFEAWASGTVLNEFTNNLSVGNDVENMFNGAVATTNSWQGGLTASEADFESVDYTVAIGLRSPFTKDLPETNFLKLASGSDMIDAGTDLGFGYKGSGRDIGAYERA